MLEFNDPEDYFIVTGRGICYTSSRWTLPEGMWEPNDLKGEIVLFCGTEREVIAVETFAIMRSPDNPYTHSFGLMFE